MYVAMFTSRSKDNTEVTNFKPRTKMFFADQECIAYVGDFEKFVKEGVPGEMSRFYISVSARNMEKTQKELACRLIKDEIDMRNLNALAVSIAMQSEHEITKKWLFDFDCPSFNEASEFFHEINMMSIPVHMVNSPNGYSIIVDHGFDTRDFLEKWNKRLREINPSYGVELKRNAMLIVDWEKNVGE